MNFSILIAVYFREQASIFNQALESLVNQSVRPTEIVLVKDGPLTNELEQVIDHFDRRNPGLLRVISIKENQGLGGALEKGLHACRYDLIARMDSDDIAQYERFEKQIAFLKLNPEVDVVGTALQEFSEVVGDSKALKKCPELHEDMIKIIKLRSPLNHATIMFRKERVLKAGGYSGETKVFEDYALFVRLWQAGLRFHNLPDILYYMRVDTALNSIRRRCGVNYLRKEIKFLEHVYQIGAFTKMDLIKYGMLKFPIRLMPPRVVLFIYNTFLRK